ncbi:MAG: integrase [Lachnospiraceae bacterium]|nr:integrase [Lachnospiraceae bacterium]
MWIGSKCGSSFKNQNTDIEGYDEALVRRRIETVTVYEEKLVVEFKAGVSPEIVKND